MFCIKVLQSLADLFRIAQILPDNRNGSAVAQATALNTR
jgi:hypothetical protein